MGDSNDIYSINVMRKHSIGYGQLMTTYTYFARNKDIGWLVFAKAFSHVSSDLATQWRTL